MFTKLIAIAVLCTTIFSIQAFAIESSSSLSSSIDSLSKSTGSSSTNSNNIILDSSSSFSSQNSLNPRLFSSLSSNVTSNSISALISTNSNSSTINCQVAASSQNVKTNDENKIECDNVDIESNKDDKSKETITKKEKNRYKQCKKDEEKNRKLSHKNFETACKKKPKKILHDLTDEDYNILFDNLEQIKDEIKPLLSSSSQPPTQIAPKPTKIGFIDLLFGHITAEAGMTDGFKLPFANGMKVKVQQDVHDGQSHGEYGAHAALDITGGINNGESIKATKSGTVILTRNRAESGFGNHVVVQMDEGGYAIYGHLSSITVSKDSRINQGAEIGKMGNTGLSDPTAYHIHLETISSLPSCKYSTTDQYNSNQVSVNSCWSTLPSIDLKPQFVECYSGIQAEMNTCGYWKKTDGTWTYPNIPTWPNIYTSQNQGTPPKPATFNYFNGSINFGGWQMDVQNAGNVAGDGTYRGTPVQIRYSPNVTNQAQKWFYDQQGKEIKGMNDYCLDAGDSQGRLVIWTCNGTANQKWTFYSSGLIKNQQNNQCIAIPNGQPDAVLGFSPCGSTGFQAWSRSNITLPSKVLFRRENTNQCMASYSPYSQKQITTQDCNSNDESQQWEWMYSGVGYVARKFGTNFCMDVYNPASNKAIQVYDCNWTDSQKWWYNNNKLLSRAGRLSNNQCVAKWMPNNGQGINSWNCDSTDQNQRWDTWNV
jgi:murein DD-endopeptidase MepM/ murein hydrolase activator NlpD